MFPPDTIGTYSETINHVYNVLFSNLIFLSTPPFRSLLARYAFFNFLPFLLDIWLARELASLAVYKAEASVMLKQMSTDMDYKAHLKFDFNSLSASAKSRLETPSFKEALQKMINLDLDVARDIILGIYSSTGRPGPLPQSSCVLSF
jgi:hypothetical protein